jgi:hypothetical protein
MVIEVTFDVTDVYISTTVSPVYVNVSFEAPSGGGGAVWGDITGTLSDQTDLQNALNAKFDDPTGTTSQYLRGDGSLAAFPAIPSGTVTSVGLTMPSAFSVANSPITSSGTLAVTGAGTAAQYIRGDGSLATFPSLTGYVPYTGATANVDLGTHRILAQNATISSSGSGDTFTLNHSSGSGSGLNITKGGNGEGLYINKTSGSGNAATIIGTLNATSFVKSGGTSSQFLKADGSVDSTTYVGGSGVSGQVSYWNGTNSQTGSNNLFWDATNARLGIGTNAPHNTGVITVAGNLILRPNGTAGTPVESSIRFYGASDAGTGAQITTVDQSGYALGLGFSTRDGATASEKLRIFRNGNILIQNGGTFTDGGQRLQVQGTTLLNGNVTFSSATGMFWDATNSRLGIGTNAPAVNLDILGTTNAYLRVTRGNNSTGDAAFVTQPQGTLSSSNKSWNYGLRNGSNSFSFWVFDGTSTATYLNIFNNGNLALQNGGTFTDSGQRLQVQGTTLLNGNVTISGSTTASSAIARGLNLTSTLVAAANNDVLVGLDINPTFTNGAFTGVSNIAARIQSGSLLFGTSLISTITSAFPIQINLTNNGSNVGSIIRNGATNGYASFRFYNDQNSGSRALEMGYCGSAYPSPILTGGVSGESAYITTSGNYPLHLGSNNNARLIIFGGGNVSLGSSTDSGERLQVTGTAKITSKLSMGAGTTSAAQINLASSTDPTSPSNGDIWFDGTDIKMRILGVTKTFTLI